MTAFSVAVTDVSSRNISWPFSLFAVNVNWPLMSTRAPSSVSARKCVSSRLPADDVAAGWRKDSFSRAGDERTGEQDGSADLFRDKLERDIVSKRETVCIVNPVVIDSFSRSTVPPSAAKISSMTCMSSISGRFLSVDRFRRSGAPPRCRVGRHSCCRWRLMVPLIGNPPSMWYSYAVFFMFLFSPKLRKLDKRFDHARSSGRERGPLRCANGSCARR